MEGEWLEEGIDWITGERFSWQEQDFNFRMSSRRWSKEPALMRLEASDKTESQEVQPEEEAPQMHDAPFVKNARVSLDDDTHYAKRGCTVKKYTDEIELSKVNVKRVTMSPPNADTGAPTAARIATFLQIDRTAANTRIVSAVKRGDVAAYESALFEGADVCVVLEDGQSLLHVASAHESPEIVRRLILLGMDVHAGSPYNGTAMHVAAGKGSTDVIEMLLYWKAAINATDGYGQTPLVRAIMNGKEDNVVALLNAGADERRCLELAVKYGSTEMLRGILQKTKRWLDLDIEDEDGLTPLMQAASWGDGMEGTRKIHTLLEACAVIDQVSSQTKQTALQIACVRGHEGNLYHLLARGASVMNRDKHGLCALDVALIPRGHSWKCAGYIKAVLYGPGTGPEAGVALYANESMEAWEAPFELRRVHLPRGTVFAIREWAIKAREDARACYMFLGGRGSLGIAWRIVLGDLERKNPRCVRLVGSGKSERQYAGCVAGFLVHSRRIRMNISDVFTPVYRSGELSLF